MRIEQILKFYQSVEKHELLMMNNIVPCFWHMMVMIMMISPLHKPHHSAFKVDIIYLDPMTVCNTISAP